MLETLAETIRSAQEALERARATDNARRIIDVARGARVQAMRVRAEAARARSSSRYNTLR